LEEEDRGACGNAAPAAQGFRTRLRRCAAQSRARETSHPPRPQEPRGDQSPPGIDLLSPLSIDDPVAHESGIVAMGRWARSDLNVRLSQMGRWIQSVMPSPATVWWAASRGALHQNLHEQLCWTLDRETPLFDPLIRQAWRLVLEAIKSVPADIGEGWWAVQTQIQREGWTARTIREFSIATRPRLIVQRSWAHAPVPPDETTPPTLSRIGHFEVHYPKLIEKTTQIPDAALPAVLEAIRANLELGDALESEISQVNLRLPTLYPEDKPGEHVYTESEEYYVQFARLFERLAAFDAKGRDGNISAGTKLNGSSSPFVFGLWPSPTSSPRKKSDVRCAGSTAKPSGILIMPERFYGPSGRAGPSSRNATVEPSNRRFCRVAPSLISKPTQSSRSGAQALRQSA
jgi:hypothetical protein